MLNASDWMRTDNLASRRFPILCKEYKFQMLMVTGFLGSRSIFVHFFIQTCKSRIEQILIYSLLIVIG